MSEQKRVLLAKMGLDCHDTGIITVAKQLRDSGFEIIYLGLHNTALQVTKVAVDEDVDVIGVSFLSGQHMAKMRELIQVMRKENLDLPVICGGVIPEDDARELIEMGVTEVIKPGMLTEDLLRVFRSAIGAEKVNRASSASRSNS